MSIFILENTSILSPKVCRLKDDTHDKKSQYKNNVMIASSINIIFKLNICNSRRALLYVCVQNAVSNLTSTVQLLNFEICSTCKLQRKTKSIDHMLQKGFTVIFQFEVAVFNYGTFLSLTKTNSHSSLLFSLKKKNDVH